MTNKISYLLAQITPINNPALPGLANKSPAEAPALLGKFIGSLVGVLLVFATIFSLAQAFQAGLEWISSGGDKTGLENARNRLTNALIGLVLVFAAWSFYLVILQFLGISLIGQNGVINIDLPSLTK